MLVCCAVLVCWIIKFHRWGGVEGGGGCGGCGCAGGAWGWGGGTSGSRCEEICFPVGVWWECAGGCGGSVVGVWWECGGFSTNMWKIFCRAPLLFVYACVFLYACVFMYGLSHAQHTPIPVG